MKTVDVHHWPQRALCQLSLAMLLVVLGPLASLAFAQGGPPLITDDPGTPGNGNWEINTAFTFERTPGATAMEAPLLDINYGLGDHMQLKYEGAFLILDEKDAGPRGTLSNSLVGVKWRFLDQDKHGVAVSTYPQVEFNNPGLNASRHGLVDDGTQVLIPFEIARSFGPWEVGAEVGYNVIQYDDDEWKYGVAVGYAVNQRLQLLGEIAGVVDADFHRNDPILNLGLRYELNDHLTLLFAVGRSLRSSLTEDEPSLLVYSGLSFTF